MKYCAAIIILIVASTASANSYTGICFLDALLNGLDSLSAKVSNFLNPTTTTITSTTTTTTETTTSTTEYTTTSSTTTSTQSTTTSTLFAGACLSETDCPSTTENYYCDLDNHIMLTTTNYVCLNPGLQSECKGRTSKPRIYATCTENTKCVKEQSQCVRT
jgi:hypothetical protein